MLNPRVTHRERLMVGYAWIGSRPHQRSTGHANPPYKTELLNLRSRTTTSYSITSFASA